MSLAILVRHKRISNISPIPVVSSMSNLLKYVSLVLLTMQSSVLILVMRYTRTRPGVMFLSTTAIVMSETFKAVTCVIIIVVQEGGVLKMLHHMRVNVINQPLDCVKITVPAIVYTIQNNLFYVAISNLEASVCQVIFQVRIIPTALFSVFMLNKKLSCLQWISLLTVFVGIAAVQYSESTNRDDNNSSTTDIAATEESPLLKLIKSPQQHYVVGLLAIVASTILSGFAGVYFEMVLKGTTQSLYLRNVELGVTGIVFGLLAVFATDGQKVLENGFFQGYDVVVWITIALQSFGGLMVAVVIKYADNILKSFATSCAIIISCVMSVYLFDFVITLSFALGTTLVIVSIFVYSTELMPDCFARIGGTVIPSCNDSETTVTVTASEELSPRTIDLSQPSRQFVSHYPQGIR